MKKLLLFATLATAAAVFVGPSSASAVWTSGTVHIPVGTNPQLHFGGIWGYTTPTGGKECQELTATMQLTGGTTTEHIQQFTPILSSCKGTGALAGCTITSITATGFPWTGHTSGATITQTGVQIQTHMSGFLCPQTLQLDTTAQHHMTLQPVNTAGTGNRQGITALHIGGSLFVTETNSTATLTGTLTATTADSHKYGWT